MLFRSRVANMGHRKSGKMNLVAASENQSFKNPVVNQFANSNNMVLKGLKWATVKPILDAYKIQHDFDSDEPYVKSLNRTKCKLTGLKIKIQYNPQNETWALFKKE